MSQQHNTVQKGKLDLLHHFAVIVLRDNQIYTVKAETHWPYNQNGGFN